MKSIGRYTLLEEIGRGSMGSVHRASDPLIERNVAIKTVSLAKLDDGSLEPRLRFLREAKAAGRLSHPGIVAVYDVGELEDMAYIVMEFVEGRSLKDLLDRGTPIPLAAAAEIVRQAAEALAAAHRSGVIHRDIKPGNVMVTRAGGAKITDFGIARIDQTARTRTGVLVGSPGYMSPEQLSAKPVDGRSDVFSLGSLLYELVTGQGPFDPERREDVLALMANIVSRPHEPPSRINPKVPQSIDAVVDRALRKNPAERYPTAEAMAADLRVAIARDLGTAPVAADIARLATPADVLLPDFDLFADPAAQPPLPGLAPEPAAAAKPASGLLESLRTQAEAIELTGGEDDTVSATLMRRFDVERHMRAAFDFYQELVRYIGIVKPAIGHFYQLDDVGAFVGLKVADAFVDTRMRRDAGRPWMDAVLLTVVAMAPTPVRVESAPGATQIMMDRLATANLRYEAADQAGGDGRTALNVAAEVTIHVRIMADRERGRIAFLCRNVAQFGTSNFVVKAGAVEDSVFEEFANYLLGNPNRFLAMAGAR